MPPRSAPSLPAEGLDVSRPELWRDGSVGALFERLRREDPVHFCAESAFGAYWSITRHRDIVEVEGRPEVFSSSFRHGGITLFGDRSSWFPMFIATDGGEHSAQRATAAPAFAPSALTRLEPLLKKHAEEAIDTLPVGERFDWADRVSVELSAGMLALLLGFPWEERRRLTGWADWAGDLHAIADPELGRQRLEILWECAGWFLRLRRVRETEGGEDLVSRMSRSEVVRAMAPQEYAGNMIMLILGGSDTTRSTMSALPAVNRLWPEEWEKLAADPALAASAAQELIRWQTPLAHMRRTATRDCELAGRRIAAGDKVALWYASANRDETVFDDADRFLCDRANVRRHLGFGFGVHRCVGARLAELQVATLIETLVELKLRPVQTGEARRNANCFSQGYVCMPVTLERA
ncbi:MAG TPA: cytochrome P450 [Allosphingosinicella sp.]|jgi:cytochrome P450|nr:cytochrome P450 [Allosphingosinicella sp.]